MAHYNRRVPPPRPKMESMATFNRRILAQPKMGFFNLPSDEALGYPRFSSFEHREAYIRKNMLTSRDLLDRINSIVAADKQAAEAAEDRDYAERKQHSLGLRHAKELVRFEMLMNASTQRYQQEQESPNTPAWTPDEEWLVLHRGPASDKEPLISEEKTKTLLEQEKKSPKAPVQVIDPVPIIPPVRHIFFRSSISALPKGLPTSDQEAPTPSSSPSPSASPTPQDRSNPGSPTSSRQSRMSSKAAGDEIHRNIYMELLLSNLSSPQMKQRPSRTVLELLDHLNLVETVFVGDKTYQFVPIRGDLIIVNPDRGREMISKGYVMSYEGPNTHEFEHGEIAVRIGHYEQAKQSVFLHHPYQNLELYMYNREGDWKYLGNQVEMKNTEIPVDSSPGKHLQVGSPVLPRAPLGQPVPPDADPSSNSNSMIPALIPRRGDVIIKRAAWMENFAHRENFRRSMVKWHRSQQIQWAPDDMLIRLFAEKGTDADQFIYSESEPVPAPDPGDHSGCRTHGQCQEKYTPPVPGFAELYRFEGSEVATMGWVYWGRAKHLYDKPYQKWQPLYLVLYVSDDGKDGEKEDEKSKPQVSGPINST